MENLKDSKSPQEAIFPATVVGVIDDYKVAINRGQIHDIKQGQRFLIYSLSEEEIVDPESGESLGRLEIVKGTGRVMHVQERMATIESDKKEQTTRRSITRVTRPYWSILPRPYEPEQVTEILEPTDRLIPFERPEIGDKAKPI